jgi:sugar phosphate isomerase/epimerase
LHIEYAISLWNYRHYANLGGLEHQIALIRQQGYGVELWADWRADEDLFDEANRERLRPVLEGMTVSLHTALGNSFAQHQKQIDAAAAWGGRVVVVHSRDLMSNTDGRLDVGLARDVVAYGAEHDVRIALENGQRL